MKRYFLILILLLGSLDLMAEELRVVCSFKIVNDEQGTVIMEGKAFIQGDCYRCETAAGTLYCDGKSRWIYNPDSDELVIQKNDISMFDDIDFSSLEKGSCNYKYQGMTISISGVQKMTEPWPKDFFIMNPELISADTIVTDLR